MVGLFIDIINDYRVATPMAAVLPVIFSSGAGRVYFCGGFTSPSDNLNFQQACGCVYLTLEPGEDRSVTAVGGGRVPSISLPFAQVSFPLGTVAVTLNTVSEQDVAFAVVAVLTGACAGAESGAVVVRLTAPQARESFIHPRSRRQSSCRRLL